MNKPPASQAHPRDTSNPIFLRRRIGFGLALALGAIQLAGCGSQSSSSTFETRFPPQAASAQGASTILVEAHQGGQARALHLRGVYAGRLVDVYDFDSASGASTLQCKDFAIGAGFAANGLDCVLESDWITQTDKLTIQQRADSAAFASVLADLDRSLEPIAEAGLDELGLFSSVPRDATLVLVFDDLLDAETIRAGNIGVYQGDPALAPHAARILPDASHGDRIDRDGDGVAEFYTTRVLIDLAVDSLESLQSPVPLEIQPLGLPLVECGERANLLLRLPSEALAAAGQATVLSNLAGRGLASSGNGPLDTHSVTQDIVRALRSRAAGGGTPGDGYASVAPPPRVIGVQSIFLTSVAPAGGQNYLVDARFGVSACAPQPRVGDVIRVNATTVASVVQAGAPPVAGTISAVLVSLRIGNPAGFVAGPAEYEMPYDPAVSVPPACFVQFLPQPTQAPDRGISPNSTIRVRFDRPMDPRSVSGLDTCFVSRVSNANPQNFFANTITARALPSPDLREYTWAPQVGLGHSPAQFPQGEDYRFTLQGGANGVLDRAGQSLVSNLPPFLFRLNPTAVEVLSKTFVMKFNSADEDNNGAPEIRGQFLFDLSKGSIRARPVARFSAVADASQPVIGLQLPFLAPIQTPLSNLGSRMMGVYRYHDLGLGLTDDASLNIDLEHLAWAPFSPPVVDTFAQFQMAFAHGKYLPDEIVDPFTLLPSYPNSGLVTVFDNNLLDPLNDPATVTHAKQLGYDVQPLDAFVASTGTLMMPYPMNRGLPTAQFTRYTWRDTSILAVGGANGSGVDTDILGLATGSTPVKHYNSGKVPTIGLPLLMEFRCYPDVGALGLNGLKVNIALNSSARPAFRAFSTGGISTGGAVTQVDPDNEPVARGNTALPAGSSLPDDNVFHIGQADFVVRVNRVHTIWLDTLTFSAQYQPPVIHPWNPSQQPAGTQVLVALRGATNVTNGTTIPGSPIPRNNANRYDAYGDPVASSLLGFTNFQVTYPLGPTGQPDNSWKANAAQVGFTRFVQARITLISNPVSQQVPEISGLGLSLTY